METLEIGKEATYRRLRGEVPFTFQEISLIATRFRLSLDQLIGNYSKTAALFNINVIHTDNAMEEYENTLMRYINYLSMVKEDPEGYVIHILNTVPYTMYSTFKYLSRFRICRWLHQTEQLNIRKGLGSMEIPLFIIELQKKLTRLLHEVPRSYFIWDHNIFLSLIRDISYFHKMNILTEKDMEELKAELLCLLDRAERIAEQGTYENNKKVWIYLSNINFEASYSYMESKEFKLSFIRVYAVNSMDSLHPAICKFHKEWIQSLRRYSTMITESGEMQRFNFFRIQREYVNNL